MRNVAAVLLLIPSLACGTVTADDPDGGQTDQTFTLIVAVSGEGTVTGPVGVEGDAIACGANCVV
jgi:hypothetical protein